MSTTYYKNSNTLSWDVPVTNANGQPLVAPVASYNVKVGTASGQETLKTVNVPTNSCTVGSLGLADGAYFADVTAVDAAGNESGVSNEISFLLVTIPPAAPANLRVG